MVAPGEWSVTGATALGGRHVKSGLPNQDAHGSRRVSYKSGEVVLMAVADGHGGARYVRSDIGSSLAVETAIEVASDFVTGGILSHSSGRRERAARTDLVPRIVRAWRARCLQHVEENPFTEEEAIRADANLEEDPVLSYGSTLIVAVLSAESHLLVQLGDGECLVISSDGTSRRPIPGDDRLTGGETTSLCLPDAEYDFRVAALDDSDIELVLLASDGYGVAFAADDWRDAVSSDLLFQFRQRGFGYVDGALPGWLEDSARVGGDDVTVLVAHRPLHSHVVSGTGSPGRSRTGTLVGLVVALAVGGLIGWVAATVMAVPDDPSESGAVLDTRVSTTTSLTTTTTSLPTSTTQLVESAPLSTSPPDVAGAALSAEWVVSGDGTVVEFIPDPTNPGPLVVTPSEFAVWPTSGVRAWDSYWAVGEGTLYEDGGEVAFSFGPAAALSAIAFANDHLWILSERAEWLLAVDSDLRCTAHEVRNGSDGVEQGQSGVLPACVSVLGEGGE